MDATRTTLAGLDALRPWMKDLYRHLHAHPELSTAEHETAARVVAELRAMPAGAHWQITEGIGGTGVAAVLANGEGPTVLLRADMDALPVAQRLAGAALAEDTGLAYASTVRATDRRRG